MIFEHASTWAAVLGAVAYGSGDFLGGCASRRLTTLNAVAIAQSVAVAFMLQSYVLAEGPLPTGAQVWMSVAAGLMLMAFPALIVGITYDSPLAGILICLAALLGGAILWSAVAPILRPTRITDELAIFRGAHESFFGRLRLDVADTFA